MDTIAVEASPCDLHQAIGSVSSGDSSLKEATLLCVSSTVCYREVALSADELHTSPTAAPGSCCAPCACAWLSATVTCTLDVFIHVHPSLSPHGFASLLGGCHGVTVRTSTPHFARITCDNVRNLCEMYDGLLTLPLSPADVLSRDVSTCSTHLKIAAPPGGLSGQRVRGRSVGVSTAPEADGAVRKSPVASRPAAGPRSTDAVSGTSESLVISAYEATAHVARNLPTVALLVRFPKRCRHALVLLRPSLGSRHKKYTLTYHASVRLVSESIQRVALTPHGDAVALLADTFIHDVSLSVRASTRGDDASAALVLHGGYLSLDEGEQRSSALQPLLLHIGLLGASAGQRVLRSLLRSRLTGAWYRLRFPANGANRSPFFCPVFSELVLYTSEGHALAFEPLMADAIEETPASTGKVNQCMTITYTCCVGAHLLSSRLDASASPASTAASLPCDGLRGGALLVAPPWHFTDQWQYSLWFAKALALTTASPAAFSTVLASGEGLRHRRRHRVSSVIAMSSNRRVWLLYKGSRLCVVTVPTGTSGVTDDGGGVPTLAATVPLDASYLIHDAQYVACGGHVGFLLLCRHSRMSAAEPWDIASEMRPATATSAVGDRFVHCSLPHSPVQLLFLSLSGMGAAAAAGAAAASNAFMSPLLLVPLMPSSTLGSLLPSLAHPSSRLRFVCAVSMADTPVSNLETESLLDTIYVSISSSGCARGAWTGTARLPSVWSSCTSLLQLSLKEYSGSFQGVLTLQWAAHTLSALFPHAALMRGDFLDTSWMATAAGAIPSSSRQASSSALIVEAKAQSLETALEAALLELRYPYVHSVCFAGTTASDVSLGRGGRPGGAALYYPRATVVFHDALDAFLHACVGEGETNSAGAVAIFAGFSAALRMSGLLHAPRDCRAARDGGGGGGVRATMRMVAFLHGCAQLLRCALEDVSAIGGVSALLACASHLTRTATPGKAPKSPSEMTPMAWEVWGLLLQPLFDFVWGVVRAYCVSAEVADDLLEYCSPAVQSMARTRRFLWSDTKNAFQDTKTRDASLLINPNDASHRGGLSLASGFGGMAARQDRAELLTVVPHTPGPTAASPSSATAAAATSLYTSAELYGMVRRVFLMQGASAALHLVEELQRHSITNVDVSDMVQMLETMQHRLADVAV
ncbi:hypothetical protein JKF63_04080 [Porcisia hertigi]|uniref:Uncharacterized protein n=1 Tax=Porcisia hertigi TaxID=2761500 RepID=A0A836HZF6_9TRYP|nr:hypothetical protein JKF63_04080 [Porcisia hertigi]